MAATRVTLVVLKLLSALYTATEQGRYGLELSLLTSSLV